MRFLSATTSTLLILATVAFGISIPAHGRQATATPQQAGEQKSPSRPNPDASGNYHIGDGVLPPVLTYVVDPQFTDQARRKKLGGTAIVSMLVDGEGNPRDVRVARSIADTVPPKLRSVAIGLDEKAVEAVRQYTFRPATFHGKPVPVEVKVEVDFKIY
jgi:periplasmic protein TonB